MNPDDCYIKLNFSNDQLSAIRKIFTKWFLPHLTEKYIGRGFVFSWGENITWETGKGLDKNHRNIGYTITDCADDPLWNYFSDLLPYMGKTAVVTKLPPGEGMYPHVDRKWRPEAIYIPITGCTEHCVSKIYDFPLPTTENSTHIKEFPRNHIFEYSIVDQPYLTNTHIWHSVQNLSKIERTTLGWNFKLTENYTYRECMKILHDLGYIT